MSAMFKLATEWRDYEIRVLPIDAPEVQRIETRRAFYAGAQSLFTGLINSLELGTESTDNDLKMMDSIKAELDKFLIDLQSGAA